MKSTVDELNLLIVDNALETSFCFYGQIIIIIIIILSMASASDECAPYYQAKTLCTLLLDQDIVFFIIKPRYQPVFGVVMDWTSNLLFNYHI